MNRFPPAEPHDQGMLDVGDGHRIAWRVCGNQRGKPAVVLHGGPGSGAQPYWTRYFDPEHYRIVLFDQRNCGDSTPYAGEPEVDLSTNTTPHLIADIERLRAHLGIDAWLIFGASWGSTLGIAYAEAHPDRVTEAVLFSVVTTTRREVDWITRDVGRLIPEHWERFRDAVPPADRDGDLTDAYARLLADPDPAVHDAAARAWCEWEDRHVAIGHPYEHDTRYDDPRFRLAFARLVTHYFRHTAWYREGELLAGAHRLAGIPAVLVHGLMDVSSPAETVWNLARAWDGAELILAGDAGHGARTTEMREAIMSALARFAEK